MWFSTRHSNVIGDLYHAETVLDKITSRSGFTHFERFQNALISGHVDGLDLFADIRRISYGEGGQEKSASCPQKTKTSSPDPCARDACQARKKESWHDQWNRDLKCQMNHIETAGHFFKKIWSFRWKQEVDRVLAGECEKCGRISE